MILKLTTVFMFVLSTTQTQGFSTLLVPARLIRHHRQHYKYCTPGGRSLIATSSTVLHKSKTISCRTVDGESFNATIANNRSFKELLAANAASYAVDQNNNRIFDFASLDSEGLYSLEGTAMTMASPGQAPRQQLEYDYDRLPLPTTIQPILPKRAKRPHKYVCADAYVESVIDKIHDELDSEDSGTRVPPMALIGGLHNGKTSTLDELALGLARNSSNPVNVIYITFSGYSPMTKNEHSDLLQAFLRRLVFAVTRDQTNRAVATYRKEFSAFRNRNEFINPSSIRKWLRDARIVLLVDDIHKLTGLSQAKELGDLLRWNFLALTGQYFVYTSQTFKGVLSLAAIIDDRRGIVFQCLPEATNLRDIIKYLKDDLSGAHEAIYYGLAPSFLFSWSAIQPEIFRTAELLNDLPLDEKKRWFRRILCSLSSGREDDVPVELHPLLMTRSRERRGPMMCFDMIVWAPCIFQIVLEKMFLSDSSWQDKLRVKLAAMCADLMNVGRESPSAERLTFALAFLCRCGGRRPYKDWLPEYWTDEPSVQVLLNPYNNNRKGASFERCAQWDEMKEGIAIESTQPTIAVFVPNNRQFQSYDLIAAYYIEGSIKDSRMFQLESCENEANLDAAEVHNKRFLVISESPYLGNEKTDMRFLVKSIPPLKREDSDMDGWTVPPAEEIDRFYGQSGVLWTPCQWKHLKATLTKQSES